MLVEVVDLLLAHRGLHDDRRQRVEASLLDLARERARRDVENLAEALDELVATFLRHVPHPELHCGPCDVRHDDASVAIEQRPAWRLDANQAQLVALRGVQVLVAREHLQRPQAQKEDPERGQRDEAENRDAQRQLGREPVRLAHARIRRQEATGRSAPLVVRAGRHTRTSTSGADASRTPSPTIARTSAWTGRASATFSTNAGASAVTSAWPATTSSSRR